MTRNDAEMQAFLEDWRWLCRSVPLPAGLEPDFERCLRETCAACFLLNMPYDKAMLARTAREERWSAEETQLAEETLKKMDLWKGYW